MLKQTAILLLLLSALTASAKVIYLTDKETFFSPQQFYFPGMKMPQKGALNLFLIYEMGDMNLLDNTNGGKISTIDTSNKKIMLSYSLLSNFHMYIGRNLSNNSYNLYNNNGTFVNAYNSVLNFLLTTYLPASQFNLPAPRSNPISSRIREQLVAGRLRNRDHGGMLQAALDGDCIKAFLDGWDAAHALHRVLPPDLPLDGGRRHEETLSRLTKHFQNCAVFKLVIHRGSDVLLVEPLFQRSAQR